MSLTQLTIRDFRNIAAAELDFSPQLNLITGRNGAGKTSLLEAVYFLGRGQSYLPFLSSCHNSTSLAIKKGTAHPLFLKVYKFYTSCYIISLTLRPYCLPMLLLGLLRAYL